MPHGTAIPLAFVEGDPPEDDEALLAWLHEQERRHQEQIDAAWRVVLGAAVVAVVAARAAGDCLPARDEASTDARRPDVPHFEGLRRLHIPAAGSSP